MMLAEESEGRPGQKLNRWLALAAFLAATLAVGYLGSLVTLPKIPTWYAGLAKPWFTPPNWLFGPAWTLLYVLMAVAAWRVWAAVGPSAARHRGLVMFAVQLMLNGLWSPVFFGGESPRLGLAVILALDVAVVATIREFFAVDRVAGLMLLPYPAWIAYATLLNGAIVVLN